MKTQLKLLWWNPGFTHVHFAQQGEIKRRTFSCVKDTRLLSLKYELKVQLKKNDFAGTVQFDALGYPIIKQDKHFKTNHFCNQTTPFFQERNK